MQAIVEYSYDKNWVLNQGLFKLNINYDEEQSICICVAHYIQIFIWWDPHPIASEKVCKRNMLTKIVIAIERLDPMGL